MSTTCKLCARQLVDEDIEQIAGLDNRVELLEYIFAKYNLQYEAKDILCVACQKNLKAVKLVMSRWQEAQMKQRAAATKLTTVKKSTTPVVVSKQETLLKKQAATTVAAAAATVAKAAVPAASSLLSSLKDQVLQTNKKLTENAKKQNIQQSKTTTQKKEGNTAAAAVTTTVSTSPSKLKTNKVEKPSVKTEECEQEIIDSCTEEVRKKNVPLTRSVIKKQKNVETKETKTNKQKPIRKIHNIGFKIEIQEEIKEEDIKVQLQSEPKQQLAKHSSLKKAENKKNASAENFEEEYEEQINEDENENDNANDSDLDSQTFESINITDIVGSMMQIGVIRSANGDSIAQIYEENKSTKESESLQSCIICELCQGLITNIRDFHKHLKGHGKQMYECKNCLQTFSTLELLQNHQKSADHEGINTVSGEDEQKMIFFECVSCEKVFLELYNMSRHHRDVHRAPSDRYKCTECGSCFKYKVSLTEHLAKHMNINMKSIKCNLCGRMFKNNYQLNRHMRIHTGEKPYECETCLKKFRHSANLQVHKRTHTGELPFKCTICAKGFSTSTHNRRHFVSCERRFNLMSKQLPTLVTLQEEELRFEPKKSTKSEVVFTLNTEEIINSNQNDSLLKRSLVKEKVATKRKAAEIKTPSSNKQQTQQPQKKQKQQEQQQQKQKQQVQVVQVEILPNDKKKLPTILKKCKLCTKAFKDQDALRLHMATHEKAATLHCDLCSKRFSDPFLLKRHKLEHSIKPSTSSSLSLQKAAAMASTHDDDDDDDEADDDEDENANLQELDDEDDTILLDFQIEKLEPSSPTSGMQLQSHDDALDTSTQNNFRIVTIDDTCKNSSVDD